MSSPIRTTVLSSAAAGCEHLEHVATQLPYALTVAGIGLVTGSIPLAFGLSPYLGLLAGLIATFAVTRFVARPARSDSDDFNDGNGTSSPSP